MTEYKRAAAEIQQGGVVGALATHVLSSAPAEVEGTRRVVNVGRLTGKGHFAAPRGVSHPA